MDELDKLKRIDHLIWYMETRYGWYDVEQKLCDEDGENEQIQIKFNRPSVGLPITANIFLKMNINGLTLMYETNAPNQDQAIHEINEGLVRYGFPQN